MIALHPGVGNTSGCPRGRASLWLESTDARKRSSWSFSFLAVVRVVNGQGSATEVKQYTGLIRTRVGVPRSSMSRISGDELIRANTSGGRSRHVGRKISLCRVSLFCEGSIQRLSD